MTSHNTTDAVATRAPGVRSAVRRLLGSALVVSIALVAAPKVAGAASTGPDPTATAKIGVAGISLRYPKSWFVTTLTKDGFAAILRKVADTNPDLAAHLSAVDTSKYKFYAIDPVTGANVGVIVDAKSGGPSDLAEWTDSVTQELAPLGATVLDTKTVSVSGKRAYRSDAALSLVSPGGATTTMRVTDLFILRGSLDRGDSTFVVVSMPEGDAAAATIDGLLASVRRM